MGALAGLAWPAAQAQPSEATTRTSQFSPRLTVGLVATDARRATDGSTGSELITTVTPAVRWTARGARVSGTVDYALSAFVHARDDAANQIQHRLSAGLGVELIEERLSVDLRGQVGSQALSALALQGSDPSTPRSTRVHVRSFSVAPLLRGTPGGRVELSLSALLAGTETGASGRSDSTSGRLAARLGSIPGTSLVGWSLEASRQVVDFDLGRRTEEDRFVAAVSARPDPEWRVDLRAGVEHSDVASLTSERRATWGGGVAWTPSTRTSASVSADRRAFGHSHALALQHRMRRVLLRYSDRQDVSDSANAGSALVPAYDLFFALFASQEPDPVLREQLVNSFLLRNNLAPDAQVNGGLLTSASALQRRREASMALQGQRSTAVFSAFQTESRRAYALAGGADDLAGGGLRQRGLVVTLTHRLTPSSTLGLTAQASRSSSAGIGAYSALDSLTLNWSERVGRRTTMTLGVRHSESETALERLVDNALLANLHLQF